MVIVRYDNIIFHGDIAAKSDTEVVIYDENWNELHKISNISAEEWNFISIEGGEWQPMPEIPTETEKLRADVDYILMLIDE